jgi:hypothetical protein
VASSADAVASRYTRIFSMTAGSSMRPIIPTGPLRSRACRRSLP